MNSRLEMSYRVIGAPERFDLYVGVNGVTTDWVPRPRCDPSVTVYRHSARSGRPQIQAARRICIY